MRELLVARITYMEVGLVIRSRYVPLFCTANNEFADKKITDNEVHLYIKSIFLMQQVIVSGPNSIELNCPNCQWRVATSVETVTDNSGQLIIAAVLCLIG